MATPLEKDIEKSLVRMVGRYGGMCLKWVCPGWAGVPDRILLLPGGRVMFVELKRPKGGDIGRLQKWWADKLSRLGFIHLWIRNHEDIKALELSVKARLREEVSGGDRCVCCGEIIPEGRQVCPSCESKVRGNENL